MTAPITPDERAEWRALADAATEGPWDVDGSEVSQHWSRPEPWLTVASNEVACMSYCYGGSARGIERDEDAEFIAAARVAVPRLLDALDTAEAEVARLRAEAWDEGYTVGYVDATDDRDPESPNPYREGGRPWLTPSRPSASADASSRRGASGTDTPSAPTATARPDPAPTAASSAHRGRPAVTDRPRTGHGPNCVYCSSTRGPASCPALPPDRPRINSAAYAHPRPNRITVWRDPRCGDWFTYRGITYLGAYETHAEAITAADKLAREQVGTVWTTPDSGFPLAG